MTTVRGVTLIELLVVVTILGILAAVVAFAAGRAAQVPEAAGSTVTRLREAAIRSGRTVTAAIVNDTGPPDQVTALPDGQVLGRVLGPFNWERR